MFSYLYSMSLRIPSFLFLLTVCISQLASQDFVESAKIVPSDRSFYNWFGYSVEISGNHACIGSPGQDNNLDGTLYLPWAGAAYMYSKDSLGVWEESQKLIAYDREENDGFGDPSILLGNTLMIGAKGEDDGLIGDTILENSGAVYVYEYDLTGMWSFTQKLTSPHREMSGRFGSFIDFVGDVAIIGANAESTDHQNENYLLNAGAAYVFIREETGQWVFNQKLVESSRYPLDGFGCIGFDGQTIAIGAPGRSRTYPNSENIHNAGAVFLFELNADGIWEETQIIAPLVRGYDDRFGIEIVVDGDRMAVSAARMDSDENYENPIEASGSVIYFEKNSQGEWLETQKIVSEHRYEEGLFGSSISLEGNKMVIGSRYDVYDEEGGVLKPHAGASYVYELDWQGTWQFVQKLVASDRDSNDNFGNSCSYESGTIICGAHGQEYDENGENEYPSSGAIYIFDNGEASNVNQAIMDQKTFDLYPNPGYGDFTIQTLNYRDNMELRIKNPLGQVIFQVELGPGNKFPVHTNLPSGTYIAELHSGGLPLGFSMVVIHR